MGLKLHLLTDYFLYKPRKIKKCVSSDLLDIKENSSTVRKVTASFGHPKPSLPKLRNG